MKEKCGQGRIKKSDNLNRNTLLHPYRLWPAVRNFYARVYATEIHGLCWRAAAATVHATNRPANAPAPAKACAKKRRGRRESEGEGDEREKERVGVRACACAQQEGKNAAGRKTESHGKRDRERSGECVRESSWSRRARVCSVFRMHGTSAACPRPPEL